MPRNFSGQFSSWPTDFALIVIGLLLIVACDHIG
ncbi:hypothetical protein HDA36_000966 [Nocardiopsis composta]|uniref:Uncharacterized protein n=1 Tax=Nocardiopsis composta TaxID=157465 RepID=A0A7W8QI31_9ACTN|nr:hypothetical protein [Nocardiopsis composta]